MEKTPELAISIKTEDESVYLTLEGMIFDSYLNWVKTKVYTLPKDQFTGVFGLGERAMESFFYADGVYSMWNKDTATPIETGELPGNNIYGTHPFYMYKHR